MKSISLPITIFQISLNVIKLYRASKSATFSQLLFNITAMIIHTVAVYLQRKKSFASEEKIKNLFNCASLPENGESRIQ